MTEPAELEIVSDSYYLIDGLQRLEGWERQRFRSASGRIQNEDLWSLIRSWLRPHIVAVRLARREELAPEFERLHQVAVESVQKAGTCRDERFEEQHRSKIRSQVPLPAGAEHGPPPPPSTVSGNANIAVQGELPSEARLDL
jgi:ribonuclease HI